MVTLDGLLNWVIPASIFIFLAVVIYGRHKEDIDKTVETIKSYFIRKKEEIHDNTQEESILTYK